MCRDDCATPTSCLWSHNGCSLSCTWSIPPPDFLCRWTGEQRTSLQDCNRQQCLISNCTYQCFSTNVPKKRTSDMEAWDTAFWTLTLTRQGKISLVIVCRPSKPFSYHWPWSSRRAPAHCYPPCATCRPSCLHQKYCCGPSFSCSKVGLDIYAPFPWLQLRLLLSKHTLVTEHASSQTHECIRDGLLK